MLTLFRITEPKHILKSHGVLEMKNIGFPPGSFVCFREEHAYPYLYTKRTARTLVTQTNLCPNDQSTLTANLVWFISSVSLDHPFSPFLLLHAK